RLLERVYQELPADPSEQDERAAGGLELARIPLRERPQIPLRRALVPAPPPHLQPGVGHRPAVADHVDEAGLRERRLQQPAPGPTGEVVEERGPALGGPPPLEELPQPG